MHRAMEAALGQSVLVASDPHMTGALGAAILAAGQMAGSAPLAPLL